MTNLRFARTLVWINGGVPLAILAWDGINDHLGADPVDRVLHKTGYLALLFLTMSLVITPLRKLSGWNDVIVFRRILGLWAFYYAAIHFCFFCSQQMWSVSGTYEQIRAATYMQVGLISLLAMLPLAITSSNWMVRKLGPVKWQALHRLAYVAVVAGVVHFMLQGKFVSRESIVFAWIGGGLLLFRYGAMFFARKPARAVAMTAGGPVVGTKPKFWKGRLKVARIFRETPECQTFRLTAIDGGPIPFDYKPGQYLNLMLLVDGKKVNRSYTIASTPSRNVNVEMTIKRESMGVSSRHLHDMVHEGDVLDVSAPGGKFTFDGTEADSIVLIAGGVGITPVMSVLRYLTDRAWPGDIWFIYSAKAEADIIFKDELNTLAARFKNLHLTITLTRDENPGWTGRRGRLSAEVLKDLVPEVSRRLFHICGPDTMMDPVREMLRVLGVPDEKVKTEKFESRAATPDTGPDVPVAEPVPVESADAGATVTFTTSGKTAAADGKVILEVAEEAGVEIPFDCRSGICGTCKVKLLSGRVMMDVRDALSASEEKGGMILACQSHPLGDVSVEA
jgi:ferredoxin-NADP reductase/DMSO/TMAO reductase YedYZ heme-binding membrane subunit